MGRFERFIRGNGRHDSSNNGNVPENNEYEAKIVPSTQKPIPNEKRISHLEGNHASLQVLEPELSSEKLQNWQENLESLLGNSLALEHGDSVHPVVLHLDQQHGHWAATGADVMFFSGTNPVLLGAVAFNTVDIDFSESKPKVSISTHRDGHIIAGIFRRKGESVSSLYKRIDAVRSRIINSAGWKGQLSPDQHVDFNPQIAILDDKQLNLWQRSEEAPFRFAPYYPEAEPQTLTRCIRLLEAQIERAGLTGQVKLDICKPYSGEIEIILQLPDSTSVPRGAISKFSGFPVDILGSGPGNGSSFVEVGSVIGIKIFPEDVDYHARITTTAGCKSWLRTITDITNARVLSVTPSLLDEWECRLNDGLSFFEPVPELSPFLPNEDPWQNADMDRRTDTQFEEFGSRHGSVREVNVVMNEFDEMMIGSIPGVRVEIVYEDDHTELVMLDFGKIFSVKDADKPVLNSMINPSKTKGVNPYETYLPKIPHLYRFQWLLASAIRAGGSFFDIGYRSLQEGDDDWSGFTLLDFYSRLSAVEFKEFCEALDEEMTTDDYEKLCRSLDESIDNNPKFTQTKAILLAISHFHLDHIGWAGAVSATVPHAFLKTATVFPWSFFEKGADPMSVSVFRRYQGPWADTIKAKGPTSVGESEKKKRQRHYSPPLLQFSAFETKMVGSGNVLVTALPCDHSMYGSTMYVIMVVDELGNPISKILYTGDFRFNDNGLTENSIEFLKEIGGVDACISETTNLAGGARQAEKTSAFVTKEMLQYRYRDIMKKTLGAVFVQVDPKDMASMWELFRASVDSGRNLVLSELHAGMLTAFQDFDRRLGYNDSSLDAQLSTKERYLITGPSVLDDPVNLVKRLPRVRLGNSGNTSVDFFSRGKQTQNTFEKRLYFWHGDRQVSLDAITPSESVVLLTPYETVYQQLGWLAGSPNLAGSAVMRVHFQPYDYQAQLLLDADQQKCREIGWTLHSDYTVRKGRGKYFDVNASQNPGLRMSGHSNRSQLIGFLDMLFSLNRDMKLVPVHGQKRGNTVKTLREALTTEEFSGDDLNIVSRVSKGEWRFPVLE